MNTETPEKLEKETYENENEIIRPKQKIFGLFVRDIGITKMNVIIIFVT